MFDEFFAEMNRQVPSHARIMMCSFRGSPESDVRGKWRARVLRHSDQVDELANVYLCVSAMQKNDRGEFRRRKENFAGGILLMIDDVGDGPGSKFPLSLLDPLPPTALIETSPSNFQATYFFRELITDIEEFDALIRAFIERQFLSADTGMAGVNRVFRPPIGVNGKLKYRDEAGRLWRVRCAEWAPDRRYAPGEICEAFDLAPRRRMALPRNAEIIEGTQERVRGDRILTFIAVRNELRGAGMLKRDDADLAGWQDVSCPWVENHTGGADNGAAIRMPSMENDWYGAFRCHHGGCAEKGWRELTQWLSDAAEDNLNRINRSAPWDFVNIAGSKGPAE